MPPRSKASRTDIVFAALANPTRRDILDMLLGGERTVVALAERFDMARPSVSEHLKVLRDCGLVAEDKHGRFRHYRVNPEPLQEISAWLSPHERYWRERLTARWVSCSTTSASGRTRHHDRDRRPTGH